MLNLLFESSYSYHCKDKRDPENVKEWLGCDEEDCKPRCWGSKDDCDSNFCTFENDECKLKQTGIDTSKFSGSLLAAPITEETYANNDKYAKFLVPICKSGSDVESDLGLTNICNKALHEYKKAVKKKLIPRAIIAVIIILLLLIGVYYIGNSMGKMKRCKNNGSR